eukprot:comp24108_c2_seq1/m.43610 comp24108_c2_seq1/g.43610  ORF comp24108_c2_seq1/g.43610 comp24108_c2_seq1/m.43610 type:complete len:176 (-) comp24108_c2_seq1:335-862(-)
MADVERIKNAMGAYQDFPIPGILFRDIFPLFKDPNLVELIVTHFVSYLQQKHEKIDVVVGLEARGFLFGPLIAMRLGAAFAPVRKQGKLPGELVKVSYQKEYGVDVFEMQKGSIEPGQKVVIVDDLLATGGTMKAGCELVAQFGGEVVMALCVIELVDLKGKEVVPAPFYAMVTY